MRFTYNIFDWTPDLRSCGSAKGGTNLKTISGLFKKLCENNKTSTFILLRGPDNKLLDFYHPFSGRGVPK